MRPIKFRAWNTDHVPAAFDFFTLAEVQNGNTAGMVDFDRMPIQQYTGLKDKNGKEIYEGDIITYQQHRIYERPRIVEIKVIRDLFYASFLFFRGGNYDPEQYDALLKDLEVKVIGNIYENPELVK